MNWLVSLLHRRRIERDLEDEVAAHIEEKTAEFMEDGLSEWEARQKARREFGNATIYLERSRESWGWTLLDRVLRDLRYACRSLRSSPVFTITAILSLALGIGANTAIFTLLRASLWKPLPVPNPGRLYQLLCNSPASPGARDCGYSYPAFQLLAATAGSTGEVFAKAGVGQRKFGNSGEHVAGEPVSNNYFSALGVVPAAGRIFSPDDRDHRVAVLSHRFWSRRFRSDPAIVGQTVLYDETPYTVIGVAQSGFQGVEAEVSVDVWVPIEISDVPHFTFLRLMTRLRPQVDPARPEAMLDAAFRAHLREKVLSGTPGHWRIIVSAMHLTLRPAESGMATTGRKYQRPLLFLMAVVALVLLISCANVANLILARNTARQHEITMRMALGASRWRVASLLLTESLLLALSGAAGGLALAVLGSRLLVSLLPHSPLGLAYDLRPDGAVLGFAAAIAVVTALLFGLAPAMRACRVTASRRRVSQRSAGSRFLVGAQLAVSVILLVGAGLFLETLLKLTNTDLGFRPQNVTAFGVALPKALSGERQRPIYTEIKRRLESHPGVVAASYSWPGVYGEGGWSNPLEVEGHTATPGEDTVAGEIAVGPHFFEALGIRLLQGRYLNARDTAAVVVNQRLARYYFGTASPIGRRIWLTGKLDPASEIVGVVADARHYGVREKVMRMVYMPMWPQWRGGGFLVRANLDPRSLAAIIRTEVPAAAGAAEIGQIHSFADAIDDMVTQEHMTAMLSAVFGALAVVLAAIGLYGVTAYAISRRTNELGIRMALGAQRGDVQMLVMRDTLKLVLAGAMAGVIAAALLARAVSGAISGMLYGISPTDFAVFGLSVAILIAVAFCAACLPAWRASRIDPVVALRYE